MEAICLETKSTQTSPAKKVSRDKGRGVGKTSSESGRVPGNAGETDYYSNNNSLREERRSESQPLLSGKSREGGQKRLVPKYVPLIVKTSANGMSPTTSTTYSTTQPTFRGNVTTSNGLTRSLNGYGAEVVSRASNGGLEPMGGNSPTTTTSSLPTPTGCPMPVGLMGTDKKTFKIEIESVPKNFCRRSVEHTVEREPESVSQAYGYGKEVSGSCCRTVLAFLFLFFNMTLNLFTLAIVHERVPMSMKHSLPDISFDTFPRADWTLDVAEYIIVAQVVGILLLLFLHRYRTIIFKRLCLIMGVLYLFRAMCMISTVLPLANQNYYCSPQLFNSSDPNNSKISTGEYASIIFSRVGHMITGLGLSVNGKHTYCGDYLYSGHTVILTFGYLLLREYLMPPRCRTLIWRLFNLMVFCSSVGGVICIIVSRGHYLIDILLAYYVTTRVFWIYHTLAYNYTLRTASSTNYLSRVWWWYIFKYFECVSHEHRGACELGTGQNRQICNCDASSNQVIPRVFEWPRCFKRRTRCQQRLLPTQQA